MKTYCNEFLYYHLMDILKVFLPYSLLVFWRSHSCGILHWIVGGRILDCEWKPRWKFKTWNKNFMNKREASIMGFFGKIDWRGTSLYFSSSFDGDLGGQGAGGGQVSLPLVAEEVRGTLVQVILSTAMISEHSVTFCFLFALGSPLSHLEGFLGALAGSLIVTPIVFLFSFIFLEFDLLGQLNISSFLCHNVSYLLSSFFISSTLGLFFDVPLRGHFLLGDVVVVRATSSSSSSVLNNLRMWGPRLAWL